MEQFDQLKSPSLPPKIDDLNSFSVFSLHLSFSPSFSFSHALSCSLYHLFHVLALFFSCTAEGMASGQVAGIVIGALVAIIIVIAIIVAVVKRMGKYS